MAPRFSVYMPNYNHAAFLPRALESVCSQEPAPYELFVFDDASTDNSCEIVESFRARYPFVHLVRYSAKSADWVEACMQNSLRLSGDYVLSCAADDVLLPGCLRSHTEFLERWPQAAIVFPDYQLLNDRYEPTGEQRSGFAEPVFLDPAEACRRFAKRAAFETGVGTALRRDAHEWLVHNGHYRMGPYTDSVGSVVVAARHGAGYLPRFLAGFRVGDSEDTYCQSVVRDEQKFWACFANVRAFLESPDVRTHVPHEVALALERKVLASLTPGGSIAYAFARRLLRLRNSRSWLARGVYYATVPALRLAARLAEPAVVWLRRRRSPPLPDSPTT